MVYELDSLKFNEKSNKKSLLLDKDSNDREIFVYNLKDVIICDEFYPNCILYSFSDRKYYNPIKEKIASLNLTIGQDSFNYKTPGLPYDQESTPVFYFIYNTDNYYHFLYDTLPYLLTYKELKKKISNLKLLMHYPHKNDTCFLKFIVELLEILNINKSDIFIAHRDIIYNNIFISSSYTNDTDSNLPPRKEIFSLYKEMVDKVLKTHKFSKGMPEKIYVSRRSWVHNDFSNIGTDYTTKRKLINETTLVEFLESKGFVEVFTENLTSVEKILIFANAKYIIGPIGGGLANVLFSKKSCKLIAIVSPTFLEINKRFKYCLDNIDTFYFFNTQHTEQSDFKEHMRIKYNDLIGEIEKVYKDSVLVSYSKERIAGWNNKIDYEKTIIKKEDCVKLDNGLNSAWALDMNEFKKLNIED